KNRIADAVLAQVHSQLPDGILLPAVLGHELIIEKRATFAATPGLARPGTATPWPGLFLAGDWTDTGYPAVLEGAVMSGIAAAQATLAFVSGRTAKDAGIAP
ncbi:MAG TPA: FAD-dependent oxidoreductase, partial [Advenella sp.]|nr:FAD-dependent oxidoreductase [Advenella sp.]